MCKMCVEWSNLYRNAKKFFPKFVTPPSWGNTLNSYVKLGYEHFLKGKKKGGIQTLVLNFLHFFYILNPYLIIKN